MICAISKIDRDTRDGLYDRRITLSRVNSKSLTRLRRRRESTEERRWLTANKFNLRFCNSNCLGYADAGSSREFSFACAVARGPHPPDGSRAVLQHGETHPCANSFAKSVPILMHAWRTSGSAFTRIAIGAGCGRQNATAAKGGQSRAFERMMRHRVICSSSSTSDYCKFRSSNNICIYYAPEPSSERSHNCGAIIFEINTKSWNIQTDTLYRLHNLAEPKFHTHKKCYRNIQSEFCYSWTQ